MPVICPRPAQGAHERAVAPDRRPFNRVEGDLSRLDLAGDHVEAARVTSPLYRGFEAMLVGRPAGGCLVYARASAGSVRCRKAWRRPVPCRGAPDRARTASAPANGAHATNLVHAVENLADHLTHFYLFFMPDFARATYAEEPWHAGTAERFTALKGTAAAQVLPRGPGS
jgi:hydrogenase large subunit